MSSELENDMLHDVKKRLLRIKHQIDKQIFLIYDESELVIVSFDPKSSQYGCNILETLSKLDENKSKMFLSSVKRLTWNRTQIIDPIDLTTVKNILGIPGLLVKDLGIWEKQNTPYQNILGKYYL